MKRTRLTLVQSVTSHSKTNERSTRTTTPFMLRNPFKKQIQIDWLTVMILAMLAGGAILFMLCLRLLANSV